MPRDAEYLLDIVESARIALDHVSGKDWDGFCDDIQCQDAVIRRLEIIGEAARRVSSETKKKHPNLPWREMTGMRNLGIHEYDAVDLSIVWDTVHEKLPALGAALEKIVPAENG